MRNSFLLISFFISLTWPPLKAYVKKRKILCFSELIIFLVYEIHDLVSVNSDEFISETLTWTVFSNTSTQIYFTCGNTLLIGENMTNPSKGWIRRHYSELPSHSSVMITLSFWLIDDWSLNDGIVVIVSNLTSTYFNQQVIKIGYNASTWGQNLCGESYLSDLKQVKVYITTPHSGSDLILRIFSFSSNSVNGAFFGLRDVIILFSSFSQSTSHCALTDPISLNTYNSCLCPEGKYYSNGNCLSSIASCGKTLNLSSTSCLNCNPSYIYNGQSCRACASNCKKCFGYQQNECLECPIGTYLNQNSTCVASCGYPNRITIKNGISYCLLPCENNLFLYPNGSCLSACSFAFKPETSNSYRICTPYCSSDVYINLDRSCSDKCDPPMISYEEESIKFCVPIAESNNYFYYSEEKRFLPECPAPFLSQNLTFYRICSRPSSEPFSLISKYPVNFLKFGILIYSIVFLGDAFGIMVFILARMVQYIKYIGVSYSDQIPIMIATWALKFISFDFGITMPEGIESNFKSTTTLNLPPFFAVYRTQSNFVLNMWETIILIGGIISFVLVFMSLEFIAAKIKKLQRIYLGIKFVRIRAQNLLLIVLYSNFGNILFFGILQFKYPNTELNSSTTGLVVAGISIFAFPLFFIPHLVFLIKQNKLRKRDKDIEDLPQKFPGFQVIFKNYRAITIYQEGFVLFFILRDVLFIFVVVLALNYPIFQMIGLVVLNLSMIIYINSQKPYKSTFQRIEHSIYETYVFLINLGTLIASVLDETSKQYVSVKEFISQEIMYMNVIFPYVILGFLIMKILRVLVKFYNDYIIKKARYVKKSGVGSISQSQLHLQVKTINLDETQVQDESQPPVEKDRKDRVKVKRNLQTEKSPAFAKPNAHKQAAKGSNQIRSNELVSAVKHNKLISSNFQNLASKFSGKKDFNPKSSSSGFKFRIPINQRLSSSVKTTEILLKGVELKIKNALNESSVDLKLDDENQIEVDLHCKERGIILDLVSKKALNETKNKKSLFKSLIRTSFETNKKN